MFDRIVEWARQKSISNPVAFGLVLAVLLSAVFIPALMIFPWLGHYDDPRWQEFSIASVLLLLIAANRKYWRYLGFWMSLVAVGLAHIAVLRIFARVVPHPHPDQYFLLTYVDFFIAEWVLALYARIRIASCDTDARADARGAADR
jgi:hypothetical protein